MRERGSVKWRWFPPDVLPAWVAEMDTPLAPPITDALVAAVRRGDTGYATPAGLPEAFAEFASRRYGWQPDPARMTLMPDVMRGIVETLTVITEPGAAVVVNTPVYSPFFFWLEHMGRRVVQSTLRLTDHGYRLDLDRLERDFAAGAAAYLMCNPHNPTGAVFTREELLAAAELADRHGVRVVVDEIHAPLTYPEARHVPFASLPAEAARRSVIAVSASKAWNLAGLKASLLVAGPDVWPDVQRIPEEISYAASIFGVVASEAAFRDGEPWLDELLADLDANRARLGSLLADHIPEIGYHPPQGTYLTWLDCRSLRLPGDPAEIFLEHGKVAVNSGPTFGDGGDGFVRLNLATAPDHLAEAVRRIGVALHAVSNGTSQ
ncbi:MAG: aminotransferase class I/II-fold pyridoxal phosphate-dependent enzyme [Micromonosporaceae bacterium]|nr:aminotransferase class I/II-fold pyridoxal phosphate-dependent enzyme [Micromonosporaceae bacterium]